MSADNDFGNEIVPAKFSALLGRLVYRNSSYQQTIYVWKNVV